MIDLSKLQYKLLIMTENGVQYNVKDFTDKLLWEENEKELSMRITFNLYNKKTDAGYLSDIAKLGCLAGIYVSDGTDDVEVARGYIKECNYSNSSDEEGFSCTAYDELYSLQKSQDNIYIPAGQTTKGALEQVLTPWGITIDQYNGPEAVHEKFAERNKSISDMITDILDDAEKKGQKKCFLRAEQGNIKILPVCVNETVYVFNESNGVRLSQKRSIANMVTRVKILGMQDDEGRSPVEAVVDGETRFGIIQKIISRDRDKSVEDAKQTAQEMIDKDGKVDEQVTLELPDVPFIRKGDMIYVQNMGTVNGYQRVLSIQHNADSTTMSVTVEKVAQENVENGI